MPYAAGVPCVQDCDGMDALNEIETTEKEFDAMWAEGSPVEIVAAKWTWSGALIAMGRNDVRSEFKVTQRTSPVDPISARATRGTGPEGRTQLLRRTRQGARPR
mgnify:CR=1 FL=1